MKPPRDLGRCSICRQPAERSPATGKWWHLSSTPCGSSKIIRSPTTSPFEPARFIPDNTIWKTP